MNSSTIATLIVGIIILGLLSLTIHSANSYLDRKATYEMNKAYFSRVTYEVINSGVLDYFFVENKNGVGLYPNNPDAVKILNQLHDDFNLNFEIIIDNVVVYRTPDFFNSTASHQIAIRYFYVAPDLSVHDVIFVWG